MKKLRMNKVITTLLAVAMIAGVSQNLTGINTVMASGTTESYNFVEKADLLNLKTGKIIFGKNEKGNAQEWYLLGTDSNVSGDNVAIVAAAPIKESQVFEGDGKRNKKDSALWEDCIYASDSSITEVHPNHYGASDLRVELKEMVNDTDYFSAAESTLLNATKVSNEDTRNRVSYITEDKLYAMADVDGKLMAGSDDDIEAKVSVKEFFWLRTANGLMDNKGDVLTANQNTTGANVSVEFSRAVLPASNLNISNVLFASTASSAQCGKLDEDGAMILRMDGSQKTFGSATYDKSTGNVKVDIDASAKNPVSLIVVGDDWAYSKQIEKSTVVTTEMIQEALSMKSDISLDKCKIWVEETDGIECLTYARLATEGRVPDETSSNNGDTDDELGETDDNKSESSDEDKTSSSDDKNSGKTESTTTGDYTPITVFIALVVLSMAGIVIVFYMRSKQK